MAMKKQTPNNFGAGVICAHLGITLAYLVVVKDHPKSDTATIAQTTKRSNDQIFLALNIPGAHDACHLFGNQVLEWVPQLSMSSKGLGVAWAWTY
jgi:hypothetical protein